MNIARNRLVLWCLISSVGIAVGMVRAFRQRGRIRKTMLGRGDAPARFQETFATLHRPQIAVEIRQMLAGTLRADLANLLPTDRFGHELGFGHEGDERLLKFITEVEGRYDVSLPDVRTCLEMSVGEFVEMVDRQATAAK